jgi:hypothetical protein
MKSWVQRLPPCQSGNISDRRHSEYSHRHEVEEEIGKIFCDLFILNTSTEAQRLVQTANCPIIVHKTWPGTGKHISRFRQHPGLSKLTVDFSVVSYKLEVFKQVV